MVLQERTRVIVKLSQQPASFPSEITRTSGLVTERFHLIPRIYLVRYMRLTNALDHTSRGVYIVHDLMWSNDDHFYLPHDTKEFISAGCCPEVLGHLPGDVQCSQEDGRSGVFISVDALLLEYEKQREVNIFSFVRNMFKDSMAWSKQFDSIDSFTKRSWRRIHKVNFIGKDCYSNQHCWCTCTCTMYACSLNSSVKYCFNEFCWVFLNVFF